MKSRVFHFTKWQIHTLSSKKNDIHVIRKLRQWGRHLAMGEIAVSIVRASGFCLEIYAK